jgi:2-dehydropantoate 2-reductase
VGCYYGGRLAQHGLDVHFLMRRDLAQVRAQGLKVLSIDGSFSLPHPNIHSSTVEMGRCDLVIIALKTTANAVLCELLPPLLDEHTLVLTLQNGLGNEEFLARHFGEARVLGGMCFVCINRTSPGIIEHIAQGAISIGEIGAPAGPRTHELGQLLQHAGIRCRVVDNLAAERWIKLAWNIPFNGLPIVTGGLDTSRIMADPDLSLAAEELSLEIVRAARHLGHEVPDSLVGQHLDATRTMGPYRPSSLIDFTEGRDVEVESIWGEPLRRARAAGYEMPRLALLRHLIASAVARRDHAAGEESEIRNPKQIQMSDEENPKPNSKQIQMPSTKPTS